VNEENAFELIQELKEANRHLSEIAAWFKALKAERDQERAAWDFGISTPRQ
jgi:hypothetical protein